MKKHIALIEALETRIAPAVIFTVETSTNSLVSFDSATPGTLLGDTTITGLLAGEHIAAIDFRPATGELYGIGLVDDGATRSGRLYKINPATAAATLVGPAPFSTTLGDTDRYGFDFNPTVDRIRVTNLLDANFRLNPNDGALVGTDTNISNGVAGDENVTAVAYDRNFGSTATTLYGYDFESDNLVTVGGLDSNPSPNGGLLVTVAHAKVGAANFLSGSLLMGFDIGGPFGGPDVGWLGMSSSGSTSTAHLYTIDLATAAMTDLGIIGAGNRVFGGLAVQLDAAAPAISPDSKTATWRDLDGDAVTLKITKGTLTPANFRMLDGAGEGSALSKLTLSGAAFAGTNITITAKPGPSGGDGRVNIGAIDATDVDLGAVSIGGDFQKILAGVSGGPIGLKSLKAASFAGYGTSLIPSGESVQSTLKSGFGSITIAGDFAAALVSQSDGASITIGGDLLGGSRTGSGSVSITSGITIGKVLGKLTIGGDAKFTQITAGLFGGFTAVTPDAAIGAVKIGGNFIASSIAAGVNPVNGIFGDGDDVFATGTAGNAAIVAKIASITIGGQLLGTVGGAPDSFGILAEQIGKLTIGKIKQPLTAGKDDFLLGFTGDVRVREL